jgi:integrase
MKAGIEHQIPLTDEMLSILNALPREDGNPHLFIGTTKSGTMSENALINVLKRMDRKGLTQHGFRASFKTWAGETTAHPREVIEHGLAHQLLDKAEASYDRGTRLEKRRKLMADWSKFCGTVRSEDANVVSIHSGAS